MDNICWVYFFLFHDSENRIGEIEQKKRELQVWICSGGRAELVDNCVKVGRIQGGTSRQLCQGREDSSI